MKSLFAPIIVNGVGSEKIEKIRPLFENLLSEITKLCDTDCTRMPNARELAIVGNKLQQAAFYAVRAVALAPENQQKT